jgi:CheY-like chemotaxis protein
MAKKILFVDDEDWSVDAYFDKLRDHGLQFDLAIDGDEAIDRLRSAKYDLIILDIMVPPGNKIGKDVEPRRAGAILLDMIRKEEVPNMKTSPTVPVVVLTAVTDQKLLEDIRKLNVTEIFHKPAPFDEVTEKLLALVKNDKVAPR